MGMCVVAALALVFSSHRRKVNVPDGYDDGDDVRLVEWFTGPRVVLLALSLLMLGGMLMSASRAGFGASVAGMLFLGLLLMRGRWRSRPELRSHLLRRARGLPRCRQHCRQWDALQVCRLGRRFIASSGSWSAAFQAIAMSPWLEQGLGGFGDVFALLQPSNSLQPNDIAHSTPLETVVELGLIAAIPAMVVLVLPWAICLRGA